jgi:hypothetical protein
MRWKIQLRFVVVCGWQGAVWRGAKAASQVGGEFAGMTIVNAKGPESRIDSCGIRGEP